jgi:hypothetical protein
MQGGHPGGSFQRTRNPNGLGFVSEDQIKKNTRETLEKELVRTDIGDNEKNKIATDLMIKQSKDIAQSKG